MRSYTMELGTSPHARAPVAASTTSPPTTPAPVAAPASVPEPAPTAATSAPTAIREEPPPPATARAAPAPPPAAAPRATEHAVTAWTVQVGTFSSRENAAHLMANLKSHGFSPTLSEALRNGHKLFRVRVGVERDRAAAQKLLARLRAAGEKSAEVVPR
jgi:cell division septation protein DedD